MTGVRADDQRCVGSGSCEMLVPDVFRVGDDGVVEVLQPEPEEGLLHAVEDAVAACPTGALSVRE